MTIHWRKWDGSTSSYDGEQFQLGAGIPRKRGAFGFRTAIFDLAFGYVSGFPVRDILVFSFLSLFPSRIKTVEPDKE